MTMNKLKLSTTRPALPQIYAYTTPGVPAHEGMVKIGYTDQLSVEERIRQQTQTADIHYRLEWSGNAVYESSMESFRDSAFHDYLVRKGYQRKKGTEWFWISPEEAQRCFYDFRVNRGRVEGPATTVSYTLRDSQEAAVRMTMESFRKMPDRPFLWNAKPRFGKTLAVYDLCMRMKLERVLVLTNRPAVAVSWYEDYLKFVGTEKYCFVSRIQALHDRPDRCMTREEFVNGARGKHKKGVRRMIEFVSLQDLKGSIHFGGDLPKLEEVADLTWDLLVIDEAHEGVETFKTDIALDGIKRTHTLHLSGTPFRALASAKFASDAIYNWTYVDECVAREEWDESMGTNPYADMPRLQMYTYRMGDIVLDRVREGVEIDGAQEAYAFDLNEFFRVERGRFVHNEAVDKWLDALTTNEKYPFSTPELRQELRHTFWLLDRVDSAKKLADKLRAHPAFRDIEIVVAAGDGKTDEDQVIEDESSLERVRNAIKQYPNGTITLSVGQLTTGVTVPEWTGVLILSNLQSPALYMQAAFRAQNPYLYRDSEGKWHRKERAYIFDFDPARTLTVYEEMANGLSAETAAGGGEVERRRKQIGELLNFFPVIGEDEQGTMMELDAAEVMRIPRVIRSKEVVRSGFMSNFLFANISNIYGGASSAIVEIINRLEPVKAPARVRLSDEEVRELSTETDEEGNAQPDAQKVQELQAGLFGGYIYEELDQRVEEVMATYRRVAQSSDLDQTKTAVDRVSEQISGHLLQKSDQNALQAGTHRLSKHNKRAVEVKIRSEVHREIAPEWAKATIEKNKIDQDYKVRSEGETTQVREELHKEAEAQKQQIDARMMETIREKTDTLIQAGAQIVAEQHEVQRIEEKQRDTNELVRDHLRGFSRTIPSFLMAYGSEQTTLATFEVGIPDEVFVELTGISKEQFRLLRDGGTILNEATGVEEPVPGHFFDEVVFDDSVQEFEALRKRLANYFDPEVKEDIFNYIPPQRTNQIFTPKRVVRQMVDLLEEENPGCFSDPTKTFADLYMKSGQYITEIVKRLYTGLAEVIPDQEKRLRHIFREQVYGLAPTQCIYDICRRYILGFSETLEIPMDEHNLRRADSLPAAKEDSMESFLEKVFPSRDL